jgi:hypothetical protein
VGAHECRFRRHGLPASGSVRKGGSKHPDRRKRHAWRR